MQLSNILAPTAVIAMWIHTLSLQLSILGNIYTGKLSEKISTAKKCKHASARYHARGGHQVSLIHFWLDEMKFMIMIPIALHNPPLG